MALFTVEAPDGRLADVEAPDPETAAAAVSEAVSGGGGTNQMAGGGLFDDLPERGSAAPAPAVTAPAGDFAGVPDRAAPPPPARQEPYSGTILPFSKDDQGNVSFDSDAGLVGMVKRAVTFPADAVRGKVDPMSDEGIGRAAETALTFNPVSAGARGGMGWAGAKVKQRPVKPKVPTSDELHDTASFGFNMAREMDVRYDPAAVQTIARGVLSEMHKAGFREVNAPKTFAEIRALLQPAEPGAFATIDDLHAVRQALGKAARDFNNPVEQEAAGRFIRVIDEFIQRPEGSTSGPAAAAGGVWEDAMGNYAASKRSDRLQGVEENTVRRAAATNSGLNIDNTIRQRVSSLLENAKTRAGFDHEEIALLESVANGKAPRKVLRFIGNLLGGGGGLGALVGGGVGGVAGGVPGAAAVVGAGLGAKVAANQITKRGLRKVDETTRMRSPLYQERARNPGKKPRGGAIRSAPGRAAPVMMTPEERREYEEYLRQKYAPDQGA